MKLERNSEVVLFIRRLPPLGSMSESVALVITLWSLEGATGRGERQRSTLALKCTIFNLAVAWAFQTTSFLGIDVATTNP